MGGDFCPSSPLLFHITFSFIGSLSRPDPICLFHEWPLKLRLHRYLLNQQNQRLLLLLGFRPMGKYSRILLWGPMVLLCGLGKGSRVRKERAGAQQGKGGWWGGGRPLAFPRSQGWLVSLELCFFWGRKGGENNGQGPWKGREQQIFTSAHSGPDSRWAKNTHSLFSVSLHSVPTSSLLLEVFSLLRIGEEKDRQVGEDWPQCCFLSNQTF